MKLVLRFGQANPCLLREKTDGANPYQFSFTGDNDTTETHVLPEGESEMEIPFLFKSVHAMEVFPDGKIRDAGFFFEAREEKEQKKTSAVPMKTITEEGNKLNALNIS